VTQGTLYLVATPIGNLEDITLRALHVLKKVNLVACEDTRRTAKLLNRYQISTPRESYHEHNEASRTPRLMQILRAGRDIALVSDAGTPIISDPGCRLVLSCRKEGIPVIPVPGPSAAIAALVASGLPADSFFFGGFLPGRASLRKKRLQEWASIAATLVFYEAPHRLVASLQDMTSILGPRQASLARELTKVHEEHLFGTLPELLERIKARSAIRGEITITVAPCGPAAPSADGVSLPLKQVLEEEMRRTGFSRSQALKAIARRRGISRNEAYRLLVEETAGD